MVEYIAAGLLSSSFFSLEDKVYLKKKGLIRGKKTKAVNSGEKLNKCN